MLIHRQNNNSTVLKHIWNKKRIQKKKKTAHKRKKNKNIKSKKQKIHQPFSISNGGPPTV